MAQLFKGLRRNIFHFSLLVLINGCVGAMVGLERSIIPAIAETEFNMAARTAMLSFIAVFGATKALTNYFAGHLADSVGRKKLLVVGWLIAAPVPCLLIAAPSWSWVIAANIFLGVSQGLTWSSTVIMKIDLVEQKYRGLAMGLNEFAGYGGMATIAWLTGYLAEIYGLRPTPLYPGIVLVIAGLVLSASLTRETLELAQKEQQAADGDHQNVAPPAKEIFVRTSFTDRDLSSASQAGLVTNLKDGMAWGIFPIFFTSAGMGIGQVGVLTAIYPAVWGILQLLTGPLSDRIGRKTLIMSGMWVQAAALAAIAFQGQFFSFAAGAALLGAGTAMVYPVLLAVVSDAAEPAWRGSALGIYRFWRDSGYAVGALTTGIIADNFGIKASILAVALLAFLSGINVKFRMHRT